MLIGFESVSWEVNVFTSFLVGKFVSWLISSFVEFFRYALRSLLRLAR